MNLIGRVRTQQENTPRRDEFMQFDQQLFEGIARLITAGQADGSIRNDLDALHVACTVAFVLTGFFALLSEIGQTFTRHFALDLDEFSLFALNLFADALRTPGSEP